MDTASSVIQVAGLLLILIGAAIVFARGATWIFHRQGNRVRLGIELTAFFTITYFFARPALRFLDLQHLGDEVVETVALLWWLSVAFTVDSGFKRYLWFGILKDSKDDSQVPKLLQDTATVIVYAVAIMVVMHFVYGEPIAAVLATSGAAAFVIGLSAQSTIKEVFAGLSLSATRALHIGDYLEIDGVYGRVHEVNWRSISLHNPHTDSLYIFPNSAVAEKIILNYSEPTGRFKNWIKFTVEPSASPELVTRAVLDSLKYSRYVLRDPTPDMNILGFNELGIEYRIRYFFDGDDPWWDAQNEVVSAIWSTLRRHGLHVSVQRWQLQTGDELEDTLWPVRKELDEEEILRHLQASLVLTGVAEEDLRAMAKAAVRRDYEPPDCIYFEGEIAGGLYLVADGRLTATRSEGLEAEAEVATWQPGDVFGISGLAGSGQHGETAQALHYSIVYEFGSDIVKPIIERNEEWRVYLEASTRELLADYEIEAAAFIEKQRHREHLRHKTHLYRSLRDHIRATFRKGFMSSIVGTISPRSSERDVLGAVMAACALVAGAGGKIGEVERANVVESLESLHLLKHTDHKNCMAAFDDFATSVASSEGQEKALNAIRKVTNHETIAHMVVGICHGVHGPTGKINDAEYTEIEKIAEILGVSAKPDEIAAAIGARTS